MALETQQKALIIDMDEESAFGLSSSLELNGYKVKILDSTKDSLKVFSEFKPSAVFIDANLPVQSCYQAIVKIREYEKEEDPDYRCIIFVTASRAMPEQVQKAAKAGANDYIVLPIDKHLLMKKIAALQNVY